jgi:hypothetical protein
MHRAEKFNILVMNHEEKKLPGILWHTWKDNIKTYLRESVMVWDKFDWLP